MLLIFLLAAGFAFPQVAAEANRSYSTGDGRERMIGLLSSPDRSERLQPEKLVESLKVTPGSTVVDLGTGAGFLLPYLSKAAGPSGKVIAQDIHTDFLDAARKRAADAQLTNIQYHLGNEKDPLLEQSVADLVIAVDAYHHFNYPEPTLAGIRGALRPNGRFVIIDYYKEGFRDPDHIRLDKADVIKEITSNGFRLVADSEHVAGTQYRLEFDIH